MSPRPHVATLISNPASPALATADLARARDALPGSESPQWLHEGVAADLHFDNSGEAPALIADRIRAALNGVPVDVIVQPAATRRKKLFLADMDSTMIGQECIDELADYVGLKDKVSAITERAMRGELPFEPALRERVALLRGLPVGVIDEIIASRIALTPGGRELVRTMRAHGGYACLVSGGFTLFTEKIAAMIGFNENRANILLTEKDALAGTVQEPILGKQAKRDTLDELRGRFALHPEDTMAVGDGANDLAMLEGAGLGVAFRAKPAVAAAAHARIDYSDLSALLYAQGYQREQFAAA